MEHRPLATSREVAEYTGLTEAGLAQLRYTGRGPRFIKVTGRQVRYRWADIEEWIERRSAQSTADRPGVA